MIRLDLTKMERKIFTDVLGDEVARLRREIDDPENWNVKELKEKEQVLKKVLHGLEGARQKVGV